MFTIDYVAMEFRCKWYFGGSLWKLIKRLNGISGHIQQETKFYRMKTHFEISPKKKSKITSDYFYQWKNCLRSVKPSKSTFWNKQWTDITKSPKILLPYIITFFVSQWRNSDVSNSTINIWHSSSQFSTYDNWMNLNKRIPNLRTQAHHMYLKIQRISSHIHT